MAYVPWPECRIHILNEFLLYACPTALLDPRTKIVLPTITALLTSAIAPKFLRDFLPCHASQNGTSGIRPLVTNNNSFEASVILY